MDEKKKFGVSENADEQLKAQRARNRTVMLTPEIAGEMRSQLKNIPAGNSGGTEEIGKAQIDEAKQMATKIPSAPVQQRSVPSSGLSAPQPFARPGQTPEGSQQTFARSQEEAPAQPVQQPKAPQHSFSRPPEHSSAAREPFGMRQGPPARPTPPPFSRPPAVEVPSVPTRAEGGNPSSEDRMDYNDNEHIEVPEIQQTRVPIEPVRTLKPEAPAPRRSEPVRVIEEPVIEESEPEEFNNMEDTSMSEVAKTGVVHWVKDGRICGFFVTYDKNPNGEVFPLKSGRLVISSEKAGAGNLFLINDQSVSSMHAVVRVSPAGEIQVLDQLSESGTKIKRADGEIVELSGDKADLRHGDRVIFGDITFVVCLVNLQE